MQLQMGECLILYLGHSDLHIDLNRLKINFFSEYGHVAYHIKGNEMYDSIQAKSLPLHAPLPHEWGQNCFVFSENGHAVYQIRGNDTYNNMQAIILSFNAPLTPGVLLKGQNSFYSASNHLRE